MVTRCSIRLVLKNLVLRASLCMIYPSDSHPSGGFPVSGCRLQIEVHALLAWGIELLNLKSAFFKLKSVVSIMAARITLGGTALWMQKDRTKEVTKVKGKVCDLAGIIWRRSSPYYSPKVVARSLGGHCRCGRFNKWIGYAFMLWRWEGGFCRFDWRETPITAIDL